MQTNSYFLKPRPKKTTANHLKLTPEEQEFFGNITSSVKAFDKKWQLIINKPIKDLDFAEAFFILFNIVELRKDQRVNYAESPYTYLRDQLFSTYREYNNTHYNSILKEHFESHKKSLNRFYQCVLIYADPFHPLLEQLSKLLMTKNDLTNDSDEASNDIENQRNEIAAQCRDLIDSIERANDGLLELLQKDPKNNENEEQKAKLETEIFSKKLLIEGLNKQLEQLQDKLEQLNNSAATEEKAREEKPERTAIGELSKETINTTLTEMDEMSSTIAYTAKKPEEYSKLLSRADLIAYYLINQHQGHINTFLYQKISDLTNNIIVTYIIGYAVKKIDENHKFIGPIDEFLATLKINYDMQHPSTASFFQERPHISHQQAVLTSYTASTTAPPSTELSNLDFRITVLRDEISHVKSQIDTLENLSNANETKKDSEQLSPEEIHELLQTLQMMLDEPTRELNQLIAHRDQLRASAAAQSHHNLPAPIPVPPLNFSGLSSSNNGDKKETKEEEYDTLEDLERNTNELVINGSSAWHPVNGTTNPPPPLSELPPLASSTKDDVTIELHHFSPVQQTSNPTISSQTAIAALIAQQKQRETGGNTTNPDDANNARPPLHIDMTKPASSTSSIIITSSSHTKTNVAPPIPAGFGCLGFFEELDKPTETIASSAPNKTSDNNSQNHEENNDNDEKTRSGLYY